VQGIQTVKMSKSPSISPEEAAENAEMLLTLIADANLTRLAAAKLIQQVTNRPCSWRAIQSWIADPALPSSRPCPPWAVKALRAGIENGLSLSAE